MKHTEFQKIETKNGQELSATFYFPDGEMKAAVLIVPAMGVTQKYYASFASWLSTQGYLVATFDYAGIGLSLSGNLRDTSVSITDWAKFDCTAMINAVSTQGEGKALYWIGHSLGGQIFGMVPDCRFITKVINIAGGSGYWFESAFSLKWRAWWLWYIVAPLATRVYGYFPGKRLRKVGDLPGKVMMQWRRWCLNPQYLVGAEGPEIRNKYRAVVTPISSFSFTDDEFMSKNSIDSFNSFFVRSQMKTIRITPEE